MTTHDFILPPKAIVSKLDWRRRDALFNHFPLKHGWDSLALARLFSNSDYNMQQKLNCLKFYFQSGDIRNLYATLTRSGSHWSILSITVAMDLAAGGDGTYWYNNAYNSEYWRLEYGVRYTKLDWRQATGEIADETHWGVPVYKPFLYHSHHPYYRIRSARLKDMKIVIVLRDILGSMESKFYKLGGVPDNPIDESAATFAWRKLTLDAIEFFNSWGDVMQWHPNCICLRYEDLLADPVGSHARMTKHWGLDIPTECLEKAFAMTTKEEMAKRLTDANVKEQTRVSYRKDNSAVDNQKIEMMRGLIRKHLIYDFGYDYG